MSTLAALFSLSRPFKVTKRVNRYVPKSQATAQNLEAGQRYQCGQYLRDGGRYIGTTSAGVHYVAYQLPYFHQLLVAYRQNR